MNHKIFSLGEGALTVDFGNEISVELNDRVLQLARFFNKNSFAGLIEIVPAYSSLTIFYDVFMVRKNYPKFLTAFAAVKSIVENALENLDALQEFESRLIEIPVCFEGEAAPDLDFVAAENNLTKQEVVEIFLEKTYRVYMLGFLPGFAYLGEIDRRIAAPRKLAPRIMVPSGSVGITGIQTGIYPFASPGGWQIIGRTNFELFTPDSDKPCVLQAGDAVEFYNQNQ